MEILNRLILIVVAMLAVACQGGAGGGSGGDDEEAAEPEAGAVINGEYDGTDEFAMNIRLVNLNTNTPPISDDCEGDIEIVIDDGAADQLVGDGQCELVANPNFASYSIAADFVNDTEFEGEITIVFSGVTHAVALSGELLDDEVRASFAARTLQTASVAIDWDGEFAAERLDD